MYPEDTIKNILVEEEKITCPKCKGCGVIGKTKRGYVKQENPDIKWCAKCKKFEPINNFYIFKRGRSAYCKKYYCARRRQVYKKKYIYKYICICKICLMEFVGYKKDQVSCSRACHMKRLNSKFRLDILSNECIEQFKE